MKANLLAGFGLNPKKYCKAFCSVHYVLKLSIVCENNQWNDNGLNYRKLHKF